MRGAARSGGSAGFALLDVLVTAGLVVTVAAGASQILAIALRGTHDARVRTIGTLLASEKLEQLRSLAWTHTAIGNPVISFAVSDVTTDVSVDPATDAGPGLLPSPAGTLQADVAQYVDYVDGTGRPAVRPAAAAFVRRWAVRPVESDPANVLVLTVVVLPRGARDVRSSDAVRLSTIVARK
jgi:hypothetical protein